MIRDIDIRESLQSLNQMAIGVRVIGVPVFVIARNSSVVDEAGEDNLIGVVDRLFGCGTLIVSDASDERVPLKDIPHVERVQKAVAEELHQVGQGGRRTDDGT